MQRHEVLRTAIKTLNNQPAIAIHPNSYIDIAVVELSDKPQTLHSKLIELSVEPIPLDHAPLVRTNLIKLAEQEHVVLFVMHHIAFDALSEEVFKQEFQALYNADLNKSPLNFPSLPIQYHEFARWQKDQLNEDRLQKLAGFWGKQLDGAPQLLVLPTDHQRPPAKSNKMGKIRVEIPTDLVAQLTQFSHQQETTLFTTLLATFYLLLHRYTQHWKIRHSSSNLCLVFRN